MSDSDAHIELVGEAAVAASEETVEAVHQAAEENEDPEVAETLDHAAVAAESTLGRVGWLRGAIHRLFGSRRGAAT
jgi:hypothetical protein